MYIHKILIHILAVVLLIPSLVLAQVVEDTSAVEIGFDDIEDEPPPVESSNGGVLDIIHFSGRFDLNFEVVNPAESGSQRDSRFRNYHKFLFLKVTPTDRLTLDAEVLDLSYYEMTYALTGRLNVRAGKIWVPFGSTPFHHYYGGRQGDPFDGLLLPNVWSEFGASVGGLLAARKWFALEGEVYSIRGFETELGNVLDFTNGGADDVYAVGGRTRVASGVRYPSGDRCSTISSVRIEKARYCCGRRRPPRLWSDRSAFHFAIYDFEGLLRGPKFRDELLVREQDNADHWYYRYGDYAEVSYRGIGFVTPRVRYGTVIDFDDQVTNADSHNWEAALIARFQRHVMALAQYQFNLEEVNEIDNDLFRFSLIFEF